MSKAKALLLKLFKPVLKAGAKRLVQSEGDKLQESVKDAAKGRGLLGIDAAFDASQLRVIAGVNRLRPKHKWLLWLNPFLDKLAGVVQEHGDALQEKVKQAFIAEGPAAIDRAFDGAQALLIARIEAL